MLVFVSDLHLTDGTSGETIEPGAFAKFSYYLENMANSAIASEIEVVFLGDIFDCIRSERWLGTTIRPWSDADEVDDRGFGLKEYAIEILGRIISNKKNGESLDYLKTFKTAMTARGVKVKYTYIIGNHDWLINRYPETRIMAAVALGIENPGFYQTRQFMLDSFWEEYRVVARHGDLYDPFNYSGKRDGSSLGDALTIDLVDKFPRAVSEEIHHGLPPELVPLLKELDNIRPLLDTPLWVQSIFRQIGTKDIEERIKKIWNRTVDHFLALDFIQKYDRPWEFDLVDQLELCLKISKVCSIETLLRLPLRLFQGRHDSYEENAWKERLMKENSAIYAVYGHTHLYKISPLDKVILPASMGKVLDKVYFNTGTWKKIHVKTEHGDQFSGWHVMTFVAFYLEHERGKMRFEVWNGALG